MKIGKPDGALRRLEIPEKCLRGRALLKIKAPIRRLQNRHSKTPEKALDPRNPLILCLYRGLE